MAALIASKLDQCFELSEYDWTPAQRETSPSMYLYELVNWLTTVVDSLMIKESYKEESYKGALGYINDCLMVCGRLLYIANDSAYKVTSFAGFPYWTRYTHDERKRYIQHPDRCGLPGRHPQRHWEITFGSCLRRTSSCKLVRILPFLYM